MRKLRLIAIIAAILLNTASLASSPQRKPKPGPLTGTWECILTGGTEGDLAFTLYLEQEKEIVTGTTASPKSAGEPTSFRKCSSLNGSCRICSRTAGSQSRTLS